MQFKNKEHALEIGESCQEWIIKKCSYWENYHYPEYDYSGFHRLSGPAIIFSDGSRHWFKNDQYHRLDGPAIIDPDGSEFWYENGDYIRKMINAIYK